MSTAIFKNINLIDTLPELRLTATGSDYMRQYRSATTNYGYQYNRVLQAGVTNSAISSRNVADAGNVGGGTAMMQGKTAITMSCWIKIAAWTNSNAGIVYGRNGTTNPYSGFLSGATANKNMLFVLWLAGTDPYVTSSNAVDADGAWHHLVGTWSTGEPINIYLDNVKTSTANKSGALTQDFLFRFGYDSYDANRKFNGDIDEVVIWDRRLTTSEVNELYNSGAGVFTDPTATFVSTGTSYATNLKVIHHASENTGTVLADSSGNGNTGVGKYWATGWVQGPATTREVVLWSSRDSIDSSERGIQTFGDVFGRTVIDGLTTRFNVTGVEKGQLSSTMAWTLPNTITGSSDAVQFKILANATQTSNIMDVFASDGTTAKFHIKGDGNLGIGTTAPTNILSLGNGAAQKIWIENTANSVVGRALTVAAGSTVTGGTADMAGGNLILSSGAGKGTGASSISFFTGTTLTTGSTLQTLSEKMTILGSGNVGIGTTAPSAKLHTISTTEQLRLGYDASNYLSATIGSTGSATLALTGATPTFTFSQGVKLSTLTAGRVIFAEASGLLSDDADLTFATDTLTATKIVGTTSVKVGTAAGFISSDGSTGATGTFTTVDLKTVTVKDGIITAIV